MGPKPNRYQQQRCLHFITFSCYRRQRFLDSVAARETFERDVAGVVDLIHSKGIREFAEVYAEGPSRQPFKRKDSQGWAEFREHLAEHSAVGQARW